VLLATIAIHGGTSANVSGVPSGWHLIASTNNDASLKLLSYWKADSGSEPSSYQWVVDGQTTGEGAIVAYSGVDSNNPIDASAGNTGLSATATTSAITTIAGTKRLSRYSQLMRVRATIPALTSAPQRG
jgi:hypothetical protein